LRRDYTTRRREKIGFFEQFSFKKGLDLILM